jgi:hypothetical protein
VRGVRFALLALLLGGLPAAAPFEQSIDVALILAVDVSPSVDAKEALLQRHGYVDAFRDPAILRAIRAGHHGRIAVTYVEWAGYGQQDVTVAWTVIADATDAAAFADKLEKRAILRGTGTSISSMLEAAGKMFAASTWAGARWVLDVSGDGPNNLGLGINGPRAQLLAHGVTINGLAILSDGSKLADLDRYFAECVIGGSGAFVVAAHGFESFAGAVRRKLLTEIAGRAPERSPALHRVQFLREGRHLEPVYAPACDAGERLL